MKKRYILMIALCTILFLLSSCDGTVNEKLFGGSRAATDSATTSTYKVGDTGPAGGIIFYDCDADNDVQYVDYDGQTKTNKDGLISSECGWRYLEAAPNDLTTTYVFGYYRPDGTTNTAVGTEFGIGKGKSNTDALVSKMGTLTYTGDGNAKDLYAAQACKKYTTEVDGVTYDDWFLPTIFELNLMYENLHKQALGNFKTDNSYWSSQEYSGSAINAIPRWFDEGHSIGGIDKSALKYVRPVRAF